MGVEGRVGQKSENSGIGASNFKKSKGLLLHVAVGVGAVFCFLSPIRFLFCLPGRRLDTNLNSVPIPKGL